MLKLNKESIEESVINRTKGAAELIEVEFCKAENSADYDEVILHFSNGGEISIYLHDGDVIIEGD